ncbi:MAG: Ig-like domain-containing protein [Gemmatimonadota bacterium]
MRITSRFALLVGLLVPGVGCDEGSFTPPPRIASITVSLGDCAGLEVGDTCQLEVEARTADGTVIESPDINWFTEDIIFATVDFQGQVTGMSAGQADIFAQSVPGPNACQLETVICGSRTVGVFEPPPQGPGPPP